MSRVSGASLLDAIAYLSIAAVIILGAVSLLSSAYSSAEEERVRAELIAIRVAVVKLYNSHGYGTGVIGNAQQITNTLINAGVFPTSLAINRSTKNVFNEWGGHVRLFGTPTTFTVRYDNVPKGACISLISGKGWINISVDSGNGWTHPIAYPVTVSDATRVCASDSQGVEWTSH